MSGLISTAYAQTGAAAPTGGGMGQILILVVFVVIFYFMLIRPQQKRMKETQAMLAKLSSGDEIADGVRIRVQKSAVAQLMPKGTLKSG